VPVILLDYFANYSHMLHLIRPTPRWNNLPAGACVALLWF